MTALRHHIYSMTHGNPPTRDCFAGSDEKWAGYLLGVEEAARAAEAFAELRDDLPQDQNADRPEHEGVPAGETHKEQGRTP